MPAPCLTRRRSQADLFLGTLPYNAHSTASDWLQFQTGLRAEPRTDQPPSPRYAQENWSEYLDAAPYLVPANPLGKAQIRPFIRREAQEFDCACHFCRMRLGFRPTFPQHALQAAARNTSEFCSDLDLSLASFFPTGGEFIMSMHQYMPDQAVLVDSWTLFCPECAQKMRIIMAAPAQDGKETRTFECVSGHREWMTVALH
jgi:hypothetical protein